VCPKRQREAYCGASPVRSDPASLLSNVLVCFKPLGEYVVDDELTRGLGTGLVLGCAGQAFEHGVFMMTARSRVSGSGLLAGVRAAIAAGLGVLAASGVAEQADAQVLRAQLVASGLNQPVGFHTAPGETNRAFIVEQNGQIRILDMTTNPPTLSPTPLLDISPTGANLTSANGERGLLGLAFDPNFASNGRFYVNYTTIGGTLFTRIDRFTVNGTPATATSTNLGSRLTLLQFQQDFANHNGGALTFGPDGMLYVGSGDGGSANDPNNRAVNLDSLLGKLLRLDVNDESTTDGDPAFVPNDNPFRAAGGFVRPYIWAYGLRNPWRLSFDRASGDLYIGDVGQDQREEINYQPAYVPGPGGNFAQVAGRHYGWDCREGFTSANAGGQGCDGTLMGVYTDPIKDYLHGADNACSITGGVVYRGSAIAGLQGAYLVADYCGNWVRSFRPVGGVATDLRDWTDQLNTGGTSVNGLVAIGEDGFGEMYMVSINLGRIFKIVSPSVIACGTCGGSPAALATVFQDGFDTNLGWTASRGAGATDGDWQRGVPVTAANGYGFNPPFASSGSGSAFVTDNSDPPANTTSSDVDGGAVILTSPAINGGRGQLTICFDYYLALSQLGGANPDGLFVEVSANGTAGPWTRVLSITAPPSSSCVWTTETISTSTLASAGVTNQSDIRVRFLAEDNSSPAQSIVEAGIDNFRVSTGNPPADCNGNGIADTSDISSGFSQDCNINGVPDECEIAASRVAAAGSGNLGLVLDLDGGPVGVRTAGASLYNNTCFGCHGANGAGGNPGPNIRERDRWFIRERIVFNRPALHPGGGFPNLTPQNFADIEAFLTSGGSKGRPDGVLDSCQTTLADCNTNGISNGRELAVGTQIDTDYDGVPDACECRCDINGGGLGVQDIFDFLTLWFNGDPTADFNGTGGISVQDIFDYLTCWFTGCS
jgi:glucose/arabinose dehydrogenase/mono/diheme cytochrome c family protein